MPIPSRNSNGPSVVAACAASILLVGLVGCSREPPSLEQLHQRGYRSLQQGRLKTTHSIAKSGQDQARDQKQLSWLAVFQLLEAEVLVGERRIKEALPILNRLIETKTEINPVYLRALMTRAHANCVSFGGEESLREADEALVNASTLASKIGATDLQGEIVYRRGICRMVANDAAGAESSFQEALEFARREQSRFLEARVAMCIGLLRTRTDRFDEGIDWLQRALKLARSLQAEKLISKTLGNLGWCYYRLGDYERALPYLNQAVELTTRLGLSGDRITALNSIGNTYADQGDLNQAVVHYNRALAIARELDNKNNIAYLLGNLGEIALRQKLYTTATTHLTEAVKIRETLGDEIERLRLMVPQGDILAGQHRIDKAENLYNDVIASPHVNAEQAFYATAALADLYARINRKEEAKSQFQQALALQEKAWQQIKAAEHRIPFFSSWRLRRVYQSYVELLVREQRIGQALELVESSRARLIREFLVEAGDPLPGRIDRFQRTAGALNAVLLVYWTAPERSYLWVVTANDCQLKSLPGEKRLGREIETYRKLILKSRDPVQEANPLGQQLWQTLIGPAADAIRPGMRVVVVPDGPLHRLNLETLVVPGRNTHYWLEDATVAVAPSLTILEAAPEIPPSTDPTLLLIGDPLSPTADYPHLAHASLEIDRISELFDTGQRSLYTRANANYLTYRNAAPGQFKYIHIVTHVMDNHENPLKSAIIVSKKDDQYKIYAKDIIDIPLRAELVTVPGCRSAGSRTFSGEGLVGMSWAFLRAGARRFIGSLWNVEDASSAELMGNLYHHIKSGVDPVSALRQAKLQLLRSCTAYRKPYYWAPFVPYVRQYTQPHHRKEPAEQSPSCPSPPTVPADSK